MADVIEPPLLGSKKRKADILSSSVKDRLVAVVSPQPQASHLKEPSLKRRKTVSGVPIAENEVTSDSAVHKNQTASDSLQNRRSLPTYCMGRGRFHQFTGNSEKCSGNKRSKNIKAKVMTISHVASRSKIPVFNSSVKKNKNQNLSAINLSAGDSSMKTRVKPFVMKESKLDFVATNLSFLQKGNKKKSPKLGSSSKNSVKGIRMLKNNSSLAIMSSVSSRKKLNVKEPSGVKSKTKTTQNRKILDKGTENKKGEKGNRSLKDLTYSPLAVELSQSPVHNSANSLIKNISVLNSQNRRTPRTGKISQKIVFSEVLPSNFKFSQSENLSHLNQETSQHSSEPLLVSEGVMGSSDNGRKIDENLAPREAFKTNTPSSHKEDISEKRSTRKESLTGNKFFQRLQFLKKPITVRESKPRSSNFEKESPPPCYDSLLDVTGTERYSQTADLDSTVFCQVGNNLKKGDFLEKSKEGLFNSSKTCISSPYFLKRKSRKSSDSTALVGYKLSAKTNVPVSKLKINSSETKVPSLNNCTDFEAINTPVASVTKVIRLSSTSRSVNSPKSKIASRDRINKSCNSIVHSTIRSSLRKSGIAGKSPNNKEANPKSPNKTPNRKTHSDTRLKTETATKSCKYASSMNDSSVSTDENNSVQSSSITNFIISEPTPESNLNDNFNKQKSQISVNASKLSNQSTEIPAGISPIRSPIRKSSRKSKSPIVDEEIVSNTSRFSVSKKIHSDNNEFITDCFADTPENNLCRSRLSTRISRSSKAVSKSNFSDTNSISTVVSPIVNQSKEATAGNKFHNLSFYSDNKCVKDSPFATPENLSLSSTASSRISRNITSVQKSVCFNDDNSSCSKSLNSTFSLTFDQSGESIEDIALLNSPSRSSQRKSSRKSNSSFIDEELISPKIPAVCQVYSCINDVAVQSHKNALILDDSTEESHVNTPGNYSVVSPSISRSVKSSSKKQLTECVDKSLDAADWLLHSSIGSPQIQRKSLRKSNKLCVDEEITSKTPSSISNISSRYSSNAVNSSVCEIINQCDSAGDSPARRSTRKSFNLLAEATLEKPGGFANSIGSPFAGIIKESAKKSRKSVGFKAVNLTSHDSPFTAQIHDIQTPEFLSKNDIKNYSLLETTDGVPQTSLSVNELSQLKENSNCSKINLVVTTPNGSVKQHSSSRSLRKSSKKPAANSVEVSPDSDNFFINDSDYILGKSFFKLNNETSNSSCSTPLVNVAKSPRSSQTPRNVISPVSSDHGSRTTSHNRSRGSLDSSTSARVSTRLSATNLSVVDSPEVTSHIDGQSLQNKSSKSRKSCSNSLSDSELYSANNIPTSDSLKIRRLSKGVGSLMLKNTAVEKLTESHNSSAYIDVKCFSQLNSNRTPVGKSVRKSSRMSANNEILAGKALQSPKVMKNSPENAESEKGNDSVRANKTMMYHSNKKSNVTPSSDFISVGKPAQFSIKTIEESSLRNSARKARSVRKHYPEIEISAIKGKKSTDYKAEKAAKKLKMETPKSPDKNKRAAILICHGRSTIKKKPLFSDIVKSKAAVVSRKNTPKRPASFVARNFNNQKTKTNKTEQIPARLISAGSTGHANSPAPIIIRKRIAKTPVIAKTCSSKKSANTASAKKAVVENLTEESNVVLSPERFYVNPLRKSSPSRIFLDALELSGDDLNVRKTPDSPIRKSVRKRESSFKIIDSIKKSSSGISSQCTEEPSQAKKLRLSSVSSPSGSKVDKIITSDNSTQKSSRWEAQILDNNKSRAGKSAMNSIRNSSSTSEYKTPSSSGTSGSRTTRSSEQLFHTPQLKESLLFCKPSASSTELIHTNNTSERKTNYSNHKASVNSQFLSSPESSIKGSTRKQTKSVSFMLEGSANFDDSTFDFSSVQTPNLSPSALVSPFSTVEEQNRTFTNDISDSTDIRKSIYSRKIYGLGKLSAKVKRVLRTSRTPKSDSPDLRGVKRLVKTPKTPKSSYINVEGVKRLLQTPMTPKSSYLNVEGIKRLVKTPKSLKSSYIDIVGVKELMKTPRSPKSSYTNVVGVKELMKTPRSAKSSFTGVEGVKRLLKMPKHLESSYVNLVGLKELMKTPRSPKLSYIDVDGVKRLVSTPQSPKSSNVDVKRHSRTPKSPKSSNLNVGVEKLLKSNKSPKSGYVDVGGVTQLFKSSPIPDYSDVDGLANLFNNKSDDAGFKNSSKTQPQDSFPSSIEIPPADNLGTKRNTRSRKVLQNKVETNDQAESFKFEELKDSKITTRNKIVKTEQEGKEDLISDGNKVKPVIDEVPLQTTTSGKLKSRRLVSKRIPKSQKRDSSNIKLICKNISPEVNRIPRSKGLRKNNSLVHQNSPVSVFSNEPGPSTGDVESSDAGEITSKNVGGSTKQTNINTRSRRLRSARPSLGFKKAVQVSPSSASMKVQRRSSNVAVVINKKRVQFKPTNDVLIISPRVTAVKSFFWSDSRSKKAKASPISKKSKRSNVMKEDQPFTGVENVIEIKKDPSVSKRSKKSKVSKQKECLIIAEEENNVTSGRRTRLKISKAGKEEEIKSEVLIKNTAIKEKNEAPVEDEIAVKRRNISRTNVSEELPANTVRSKKSKATEKDNLSSDVKPVVRGRRKQVATSVSEEGLATTARSSKSKATEIESLSVVVQQVRGRRKNAGKSNVDVSQDTKKMEKLPSSKEEKSLINSNDENKVGRRRRVLTNVNEEIPTNIEHKSEASEKESSSNDVKHDVRGRRKRVASSDIEEVPAYLKRRKANDLGNEKDSKCSPGANRRVRGQKKSVRVEKTPQKQVSTRSRSKK